MSLGWGVISRGAQESMFPSSGARSTFKLCRLQCMRITPESTTHRSFTPSGPQNLQSIMALLVTIDNDVAFCLYPVPSPLLPSLSPVLCRSGAVPDNHRPAPGRIETDQRRPKLSLSRYYVVLAPSHLSALVGRLVDARSNLPGLCRFTHETKPLPPCESKTPCVSGIPMGTA